MRKTTKSKKTTTPIDPENARFAIQLRDRFNQLIQWADTETLQALQRVLEPHIRVCDVVTTHPDIQVAPGNLFGVLGLLNAIVRQRPLGSKASVPELAVLTRADGSFRIALTHRKGKKE